MTEPTTSDISSTFWPDSDSEVATQPVGRLIYASISQVDGSVLDEMRRIRNQALPNNEPHGLKVALLHIQGWFIEWIEGPDSAIDALMSRVDRDTRHHSMRVVHRSTGRPRLFRPWIGAIVQSGESMVDVARRVLTMQHRSEESPEMEPASVWLSLCSPPGEGMPSSFEAFSRVMVLSAVGPLAFDLLTWLSRHAERPLIRRRFAGAQDEAPDVESDYLDLPDVGASGLRLIANARKGLAMGMTHAFLPDYRGLVLLLDDDLAYSERLIERVLSACRQVHHAPVIVGVGHGAVVGPAMRDLVERQGLAWMGVERPERATLEDTWRVLVPALAHL